MRKLFTGGGVLAVLLMALPLSGCFEGSNQACKSDCFSLNLKGTEDAGQVDAMIKQSCERMGKTTPEVLERTKTVVAGHCT